MTAIDAIKKLEKSKEFSAWSKDHAKAYLAHAFRMNDDINKATWQVGYYNPESNLITVFVMDSIITRNPDAEVFKEQKKLVKKLDITKVNIDEDKAMKEGESILKEKYPNTDVFKSFMILQDIDAVGQVWNITFVTQRFTTVNVKIDAKTGECISHKTISLIKQDKD